MTTRGKITIALAGIIVLINAIALTIGLVTGDSDEWLDQGTKIILAAWAGLLALRIEQEHDRALNAERNVTYLRERVSIMERR